MSLAKLYLGPQFVALIIFFTRVVFLVLNIKVVHHRCQAIAFMFNGGSCSSFTFYPIDTIYFSVTIALKRMPLGQLLCTTLTGS